MRRLLFFTFLCCPGVAFPQPKFAPPKLNPPDDEMATKIKEKIAVLDKSLAGVGRVDPIHRGHVEVFLKAAKWMVRHNEWYTADTAKQTLAVLDFGIARAQSLGLGRHPWLEARDKPIALAYRSSIDGSLQPYSLRYPENFDPNKRYRLDVVLHGRDASLTEVKFLYQREVAKPSKGTDYFVVEVYGRGNNAYRWAGETDVFEALAAAQEVIRQPSLPRPFECVDPRQIVLRGFSMGGAGSWHLGLHHPTRFAVMSPGAGFSTTRGYIANFGEQPDYIEKCLHIYDAVDYVENAFNIPIVAYSGEKDPQKKAADNIENLLKKFKEPHSFTHIVAPDLEHRMPPEWFAKCDAQMRKHLAEKRPDRPERVRFVTYTTQYAGSHWIAITGLDEHYKRAMVDATETKSGFKITTENVRSLQIMAPLNDTRKEWSAEIDGQKVEIKTTGFIGDATGTTPTLPLEKKDGKWSNTFTTTLQKRPGLQGPIDTAFMSKFQIVAPSKPAWNPEIGAFTEARKTEFKTMWNKYFRSELSEITQFPKKIRIQSHQILFGDPESNPEIAHILPQLPIKWTKDELVVNGKTYDAKTHVPILIYPGWDKRYVVINSGHSFREDALRGTNALLYPRLGDWAVVKPTKDDPAGFEVAAAGIFDEFWQFKK